LVQICLIFFIKRGDLSVRVAPRIAGEGP